MNGHGPYVYLKDVLTRLPTQRASYISARPLGELPSTPSDKHNTRDSKFGDRNAQKD